MAPKNTFTDELKALGAILDALQPLPAEQREFVLTTAIARLGVGNIRTKNIEQGQLGSANLRKAALDGEMTPKEFVKTKKPTSETQRMACLAFYLTHFRRQPHFKTRDVTNLNTDAACPKLSNPARTADNATKQNGFFAPAGKGNKQITPYGEDVVNALPDQDAVKALRQESAPVRKRAAGKRAKGKKA